MYIKYKTIYVTDNKTGKDYPFINVTDDTYIDDYMKILRIDYLTIIVLGIIALCNSLYIKVPMLYIPIVTLIIFFILEMIMYSRLIKILSVFRYMKKNMIIKGASFNIIDAMNYFSLNIVRNITLIEICQTARTVIQASFIIIGLIIIGVELYNEYMV